jgi:taurine dioxygenase
MSVDVDMSVELDIRPMTGAIGAEIFGVDLSRGLDPATVAAIRQALLDHLVIFFRDQTITPEQQLAFARCFGEPDIYPFVKGLDAYPEITPILKEAHETVNFGGLWHSDTVYQPTPPMGTMLYARELPPFGGDTLFANQYLAYEALSAPLRGFLDTLSAVNSAAKGKVAASRQARVDDRGTGLAAEAMQAEHPAVRTHPETGRKALFVNFAHTVRFAGMTEEESAPILEFLFQHQVRPEFCCRFRWEPGSLAFWDNRSAQHNPVNDYHGYRRLLHRITLKGDVPR